MPKRTRLRVSKLPLKDKGPGHRQASTIVHPSPAPPRPPRGVTLAQAKHAHDSAEAIITHPTLADHFHALPGELRNHIFSFLLVRPVKWELEHNPSCPVGTSIQPSISHVPWIPCARRSEYCNSHRSRHAWQSHESWRSIWAPPVRNEFMCSDCWDHDFRESVTGRPFPRAHLDGSLPCLCARREDLGILMVSRRWYEEAGQVFYTRNTFAFEDSSAFVAFATNLPAHWSGAITRVSLMATYSTSTDPNQRTFNGNPTVESARKLAPVWSNLRQLPSLSYLELDGFFLTQLSIVKSMLRLGLLNLRQLSFTLRNGTTAYETAHSSPWIWPQFHHPALLVGGLAEEVARAIKGQRRIWLKRTPFLEYVVAKLDFDLTGGAVVGEKGVVECHNCSIWEMVYWELGWQHAYHWSGRRYGPEQVGHWREWRAGRVTRGDVRGPVEVGQWQTEGFLNNVDVNVFAQERLFIEDIGTDVFSA